jgi:hypothetical protein
MWLLVSIVVIVVAALVLVPVLLVLAQRPGGVTAGADRPTRDRSWGRGAWG